MQADLTSVQLQSVWAMARVSADLVVIETLAADGMI